MHLTQNCGSAKVKNVSIEEILPLLCPGLHDASAGPTNGMLFGQTSMIAHCEKDGESSIFPVP